MYYDDASLFPENMTPLIITAAPYGPTWLPGDAEDIAVTWDQQVQAAVDCYKEGRGPISPREIRTRSRKRRQLRPRSNPVPSTDYRPPPRVRYRSSCGRGL